MYTNSSHLSYFQAEQSFQEQRVLQADPLELVCILYEGAIQAIRDAKAFHQRGEIMARGRSIARAQGIVMELASSLDATKAPQTDTDLTVRLGLLYDYILQQLSSAHANQQESCLDEALRLLEELFSAWQAIRPQSAVPATLPDSHFLLPQEASVDLCA
jgi:flagellar secretion chaperone FliS